MESFSQIESTNPKKESIKYSLDDVLGFKTSRGSVYSYTEENRIHREKVITGESSEADIIVFVPDFERVNKILGEQKMKEYGLDELTFDETILGYTHGDLGQIYIVDQDGKFLKKQNDFDGVNRLGLALFRVDENSQITGQPILIPAGIKPKIGFSTFDMQFYTNEKGEDRVRRHYGNQVVSINLKNGEVIE